MGKTKRYSGESRKRRKEKAEREERNYESYKKIRKPTPPPGHFMGDRRTKRPKKMRTDDYLEEFTEQDLDELRGDRDEARQEVPGGEPRD